MIWENIQAIMTIVVFVGGVGATIWYLRAAVVKTRQSELAGLVDTRGQRIEDLQSQVDRLEEEVRLLRAQMDALKTLKGQEIAFEVAKFLAEGVTSDR